MIRGTLLGFKENAYTIDTDNLSQEQRHAPVILPWATPGPPPTRTMCIRQPRHPSTTTSDT
eukprot:11207136-Lingulodinium_polyedra.AAC.1